MKAACPFCGHRFPAFADHRSLQTPTTCPRCERTFKLDGSPLTDREMAEYNIETVRDHLNKGRTLVTLPHGEGK